MRLAAALPIAVLSTGLAAQQPQNPTFRAGTELVEVDVVARDKNGALLRDLTAGDFAIEENGKPQEIVQFRVSAADGSRRELGASVPAADGGRDVRAFVVVLDEAHLSPTGFKRSQSAAQMLFTREFQTGDLGGLVAGGRIANNRLTTDREELLRALKDAKPTTNKSSRLNYEREWPRLSQIEAVRIAVASDQGVLQEVLSRACTDDVRACQAGLDPEAQVQAKASVLSDQSRADAEQALQSLRALMNGLAKVPGRKTVVLMSEGFIADESWNGVRDVVELAVRYNTRIYTLDASIAERGGTSMAGAAPGPLDANAGLLERMDVEGDSINSLAADTGGFVVRNTNNFDKAVARIGEDVSYFYVLGYRPTTPADGKFHRIRVRARRPGVSIRARRGYFAVPAAESTVARHTEITRAAADASVEPSQTAAAPEPAAPSASTFAPEIAQPEPETKTARGTPVPAIEPAASRRQRPNASANALRLAPSGAVDSDATEGWAAYQRGDLESAYTRLGRAAARPAAEAWVHYTLGMSSFALAQFREAADAWERVRASAIDFEPVYFDLIDAYLQLKEHDRAIRTARSGLERWPQDAELFQALGVVQTVRGSLDDAVKSFQSAAGLAPSDPNVYFNLGKAMELRYYKSRRYVDQLRAWVSNEMDRSAAMANYQRYLDMKGVYADSARAGLERLGWAPTSRK